jgi:chloramphenicol O-acetyltransferase type B
MINLIKFLRKSWKLKINRSIYSFLIRLKAKNVGGGLKVNYFSTVTNLTTLGDNVNFNGMKVIGHGELTIGNNFHSGEDCLIITSDHNINGTHIPYDKTNIQKNVIIGDNVWFGARVIILGGVNIGEGAIIQAGSVVVNNIATCAIAGGHPAKVFSERNKKHYYDLKEAKKFL